MVKHEIFPELKHVKLHDYCNVVLHQLATLFNNITR